METGDKVLVLLLPKDACCFGLALAATGALGGLGVRLLDGTSRWLLTLALIAVIVLGPSGRTATDALSESARRAETAGTAAMTRRGMISLVLGLLGFLLTAPTAAQEQRSPARPVVFHVKTALSVDDAQICVVPNVAWAALAEDRPVTIVFDGSAVTSVAKGYGWRGWFGIDSTAMERAELPERERGALAEQFGVTLDEVPHDYGAYLDFIKEKGAKIYYNTTMALLYQIDPEQIDDALELLDLQPLLEILTADADYLVY